MKAPLKLLILIVFWLAPHALFAQAGSSSSAPTQTFYLGAGPMLPNAIDGVSEIMPTWGARYGFQSGLGMLEPGFNIAKAYGVTYYNPFLSMRGSFPVEGFLAILYAGIDGHYYTPPDEATKMAFGGHVGGGLSVKAAGNLWLRTDMKFNFNPGTAMFIGFGLEMHLDGGSGGGGN